MRRALAGCADPVVTALAVTRNPNVIEDGRNPRRGGVAVVAGVTAGDVGRVLADGHGAVMTRAAGTQHLGVINKVRRLPQGGVVAVLADIARRDVRRRLAGRRHTIVT